MKIAYLGPEGSYSHLAVKQFDRDAEGIPCPNFKEVALSALSGACDACVLPIENSLQGGVLQNLDLLQELPLVAVKERLLRIRHRLIYKKGTALSDIKRIYSHEQAIGQCTRFLLDVVPHAEVVAVESTAKGVSMISLPTDAGIGGEHLISEGLEAYEGEIADEPNNYTHFLLLIPSEKDVPRHTERIFMAAVCPNRPGSLLGLLQIIGDAGLNMTKIESRPIKQTPGEYSFFIEFEGDYQSEWVQNTLRQMEGYCRRLKVIGAY